MRKKKNIPECNKKLYKFTRRKRLYRSLSLSHSHAEHKEGKKMLKNEHTKHHNITSNSSTFICYAALDEGDEKRELCVHILVCIHIKK